jgi:3-methyladenine DNA glycosylase AlkC
MAKASGFAVLLPNDRITAFLECIDEELSFAEPVAEFKHSRNVPLVCFVVHKRKITHISLGRRGVRAGTGLSRLNLDQVEKLSKPLSVSNIINQLPRRYISSVRKRFELGGLLTDKGFAAVIEVIRQLAPQTNSLLERFSQARTERIKRLSSSAKKNLAQQKEAVLTALSIANFRRESIQEWMPSEETPLSFLNGLTTARLREDQMVINDLMKIPGFDLVGGGVNVTGAAVFESESERLTVILANRLPLEQQTGADLIYFNETYQSFVMVQYKAMERDDEENLSSTHMFRLPNTQLTEEIERMDTLLGAINPCEPNADINGFRLNENPFYLKLCPRLIFNPDDIRLVPGMYLPLDYWKLLEKDPGIIGPRGGLRITYENTGRHFDNTTFTSIVAKAWVGTTPSQSAVLKDVIREILETGKAVAIAIKPKIQTEADDNDLLDLSETESDD